MQGYPEEFQDIVRLVNEVRDRLRRMERILAQASQALPPDLIEATGAYLLRKALIEALSALRGIDARDKGEPSV